MKMFGIGVDIVGVVRFRRRSFRSNIRFYTKIFTKREIKYCLGKKDSYQHFAARFAAKEAVVKASCNMFKLADVKDIEIFSDKTGRPHVKITDQRPKIKILVSLSHTKDYAIAFALWSN